MSEEDTCGVVRIRLELLPLMDELIKHAKDEAGIPLFKSRQDIATKAVREFLKQYKIIGKEAQ